MRFRDESGPALGGVLRNGIPAFRLPPEVLQRDVDRILALGVTAHCDRRIGADDLAELARSHDARIVCTGLDAASGLAIPGAELDGFAGFGETVVVDLD